MRLPDSWGPGTPPSLALVRLAPHCDPKGPTRERAEGGTAADGRQPRVPLCLWWMPRSSLRPTVGERDRARAPLRVSESELGSQLCHCVSVRASWSRPAHVLASTWPLCMLRRGGVWSGWGPVALCSVSGWAARCLQAFDLITALLSRGMAGDRDRERQRETQRTRATERDGRDMGRDG